MGLVLDRSGAAIYAGPTVPHPEAAVRNFLVRPPAPPPHRHGPARPTHPPPHSVEIDPPIRSGEGHDEAGYGAADRFTAGRRLAAALLVLVPLTLAGCHLLDQTDFDPKPPAPPPGPPPVPDPETRPALVTIDFIKANPDYATALAAAVHAVETRRPGALYDVVAVVGDLGGAPTARTRAAEVMTAIEAQGVIPARIQIGLKLEPGRGIPQVRVYLR